jgi:hypothetical protein
MLSSHNLEIRIKDYLLSHDEATKSALIEHTGASYRRVTLCLDKAGICLMPKRWHTENRIFKECGSMIKDYLFSHNEVRMGDLVEYTGYSYSIVKDCLDKAGICLMPKRWHTENKILQEFNHGFGIEEIGKNLSLDSQYVFSILADLGKIPRYHLERKFLAAYEQGHHTCRALGSYLGISESKAYSLKKKFGLPPEKTGPRSGSYTIRNSLLRQGLFQSEVGRAEGLSRVTICEYLNRNPRLRKEWEAARKKRKGLKN